MSGTTTGRRPTLVLSALTATMILLVLDSSIVGVMLPTMDRELGLSTVTRAWVVSSYLLALAVMLPLGGRLADAVGPVRMFVAGMATFTAASVGIATADGAVGLLVGRGVAGAAAAVLMPATMAILTAVYEGPALPGAMAVYMGVGQAFSTVGPAIGGLCAEFGSWRWGFLVNAPVGLAGVALVLLCRPEVPSAPVRRWDLTGLCLLVPGLSGLVLSLLQAPVWGWSSPLTWLCAIASTALLAVFAVRAWRMPDGLVDVRLFTGRTFAGATLALGAVGVVTTAATVYGAVALQESLDLAPAASGLALLPLVVPLLLATRWVAGRYVRLGPRRIGIGGCASEAVGLAVVAAGFAVDTLWIVCVGMVFAGAGIGLLMSPLSTAAMGDVPADRRGGASAVMSTCRQLGGILGVAVFSALTAAAPGRPGDPVVPGIVVGFALSALLMIAAGLVSARMLRD